MRFLPLLILSLSCLPAFAENWPEWRGPRLDGTSHDTGFPLQWNGEKPAWKAALAKGGEYALGR